MDTDQHLHELSHYPIDENASLTRDDFPDVEREATMNDQYDELFGGDDAFRFDETWSLNPQTGELVSRVVVDAYGLDLEQEAYEEHRRESYRRYPDGWFTDKLIPPPWDLRWHHQLFMAQRRRVIEVSNLQRRLIVTSTNLNPFVDREQREREDLEHWFLRWTTPAEALAVQQEVLVVAPSKQRGRAARPSGQPAQSRTAALSGITKKQFANLYNAVAFADSQGFEMNTHLAVTWSTVGIIDDAEVRQVHEGLLESMRKFLTVTLEMPARWVWVLEKSEKRGLHSHILLHLPKKYLKRFKAMLIRAVKTLSGVPPLETDESSTIFVRGGSGPERQWAWFVYLMKGLALDMEALEPWQCEYVTEFVRVIGRPPTPQGTFEGQRTGTSRSVGEAARKAADFESLWDLGHRESYNLYVSNYRSFAENQRVFKPRQS